MSFKKFDERHWVDQLTAALANLYRVHKPFLDECRLQNTRELFMASNPQDKRFVLDDALMLYSEIRYNIRFGEKARSEPLCKVLNNTRHILLAHPTLECVAVTGRNIAENDFYIKILNSGHSIRDIHPQFR